MTLFKVISISIGDVAEQVNEIKTKLQGCAETLEGDGEGDAASKVTNTATELEEVSKRLQSVLQPSLLIAFPTADDATAFLNTLETEVRKRKKYEMSDFFFAQALFAIIIIT